MQRDDVSDPRPGLWLGAVLAGGASRRFGSDKALAVVDGVPLIGRVTAAVAAVGVGEVVVIGGDPAVASSVGVRRIPDRWPGEGPLGGLLTALDEAGDRPGVVLSACDHPDLDPQLLGRLVAAVGGGADVAVASAPDQPPQWLVSAWRVGTRPSLEQRFAAGERAPHRAVAQAGLRVETVAAPHRAIADIDVPSDLARREAS